MARAPVCGAGCETDEQGLGVLGVAVQWRRPEINGLESKGRYRDKGDAIWVVFSSSFTGESAGTATPLWVRPRGAYNRLAPF